MTSKQIEYFQAVFQAGNISVAADSLFVSRSVVSRTILELEEEFGATLFVRSRSGVTPTQSGVILSHLFRTFTASCTAARERIQAARAQEQAKPLHIGITPTNAYCIYKTYLESFQTLHPNIPLYVTEHSAYDSLQLLLDGSIDVSFTPGTPDPTVFDSLDLYQNPVMLGASEKDRRLGKKVGISDILDLPLGFFNAPMPLESLLNASFAALGKKPNVVLRTSDQMLLRELTLQGKLYPLLTLDMMATWEGVRQIPLDFFPSSTNHLVWSRALPPTPSLAVFLNFMRDQIP